MDGVRAIQADQVDYPSLLAQIHDPPDPLYVRGALDFGDRLIVAVVGSRKATAYGREVVRRIVTPLAQAGVVIVSGLAYGIDGMAHEATLEVGGITVAVLGTPVNKIYPALHHALSERIIAGGGAVISEMPSGAATYRSSFPQRNRIIAGMSHATIVIEADIRSGSLITARLALEENREVFAVPGPITATTSSGTNMLIKQGARPLTDPSDVFEAFNLISPNQKSVPITIELSAQDENLLQYLQPSQPTHIDKLAESATINLLELQSQLTLMELRGLIKMVQPGCYIRI